VSGEGTQSSCLSFQGLPNPGAITKQRCLATRANTQFGQHVAYVTVDGTGRDTKLVCYFLVAQSSRQQVEHFFLAVGEAILVGESIWY
jgi:hypothetical protein